MRLFVILVLATIGLSGCQTAQQAGSSGSCNQAGSTMDAPVMCPGS